MVLMTITEEIRDIAEDIEGAEYGDIAGDTLTIFNPEAALDMVHDQQGQILATPNDEEELEYAKCLRRFETRLADDIRHERRR